MAVGDGPIKTFPLCAIKDSPTYLHDVRLLTLEDTLEFFNLILGTKLRRRKSRTRSRSCASSSSEPKLPVSAQPTFPAVAGTIAWTSPNTGVWV
jgi:hypothetical protein